jgi:dynein heavy chain
MNIISGGLNCMQTLERCSKHDDMTQFVSVLEDWDDLVCENWEEPESDFLDPSKYVKNDK